MRTELQHVCYTKIECLLYVGDRFRSGWKALEVLITNFSYRCHQY